MPETTTPAALRVELLVDVTSALPWADAGTAISATAHLPPGPPRGVLVCWPGGSYGRTYWDLYVPGHAGYSFVEHALARGYGVVAADPLGVGQSSRPSEVDRVDLVALAAAADALTRQVRADLRDGTLDERLPPLGDLPIVGVGHSLGGAVTVTAQALHGAYDAIASLGFTHGSKAAVTVDAAAASDPRAVAVEQAKAFFNDWDAGYALPPREPNHAWLYMPDTPSEVIAADDATVTAWPRQAYVDALLAGYTATFAPRVSCPILLGFGDHDIAPNPHDDVAFYTGSADVTVVVLTDSAHCHNAAATRALLWDRMISWVGALSSSLPAVVPGA